MLILPLLTGTSELAGRPSSFFSAFCPICEDLPTAWLVLVCWVATALVCGTVGAACAVSRGRGPARWWLICAVLLLLGWVLLALQPARPHRFATRGWTRVPTTAEPLPCPQCGAANHPSAARCGECAGPLNPRTESEIQRLAAEGGVDG